MTLNTDELRVETFDLGAASFQAITDPIPVYKCTNNPADHSACYVCWNTDRTACARTCEISCQVCSGATV